MFKSSDKDLGDPSFHGFLTPERCGERIKLTIGATSASDRDRIRAELMPLRPHCGRSPVWEDWNCYKSSLSLSYADFERLLLPAIDSIYPVKDPLTKMPVSEFDRCFVNRVSGEDLFRIIEKLKTDMREKRMRKDDLSFVDGVIVWIEAVLQHTGIIVIEGNL